MQRPTQIMAAKVPMPTPTILPEATVPMQQVMATLVMSMRSLQKAQCDLYKNVKNGQHLSLIDNGRCPFYLLMDLLHHPGLDDHDNKRDYI